MKTALTTIFFLSVTLLNAQKPELVIPSGHTGLGTSIALSPNGKYLLTGNPDRTCILWDIESRRELRKFLGHEKVVCSVGFSPDGQKILTASYGGQVILWDINTGKQLKNFKLDNPEKRCFATLSPDGKYILAGGDSKNRAVLWDVQSWKPVRYFEGHKDVIQDVAFSPNDGGKYVLTGSLDGTAKLWSTNSGQLVRSFNGSPVNCIDFSPDGKFILTGSASGFDSYQGDARMWDIASGTEVYKFDFPSGIGGLAISPDGKYIYLGGVEAATVYDVETKEEVSDLLLLGSNRNGIFYFTDREKFLLVGTSENATFRFDLPFKDDQIPPWADRIPSIENDELIQVHGPAIFSADGNEMFTTHTYSTSIWSASYSRELEKFKGSRDQIMTLGQSPNGKYFAIASKYAVNLWDAETKEAITSFSSGIGHFTDMAVSPAGPHDPEGGKFILTGESYHSTARLWDAATGNELFAFPKACRIQAVAFSPDGNLAIAGGKNCIQVWDIYAGAAVQTFPAAYEIKSIAYAPDGQQILLGHKNGIDLVPSLSEAPIRQFKHPLNTFALSPDGKYLAAGGGSTINVYEEGEAETDCSVQIWDFSSGEKLHNLTGHILPIESISFSPPTTLDPQGGKFLLTSSNEGFVKLWNTHTGEELATLIAMGENDWVMTTPQGHFDATPNAMRELYYVAGLEVIELEQLKERYYEPGLLQKVLGIIPGGLRQVNELDALALYPLITNAAITGDRLRVQLETRNGGIGPVVLLLNDNIELDNNINPENKTAFELDLSHFARYFVPGAENRLSLRAYNREGWLKGPHYRLEYQLEAVGSKNITENKENKRNPLEAKRDAALESTSLYALIVGTSNYSGTGIKKLRYPDKDAAAFAEAIRTTSTPLFGDNVEIKVLTTSAEPWPRKAEVRKQLAEFAQKAGPDDILLVYFSGHGIAYPPESEKGQFYYLTADITSDNLSDPAVRNNQAIAQDSLQHWFNQIAARKRILILDACNSGQAVLNLGEGKALSSDARRALENMQDKSGMFVLAGSAANKSSFEATRFGHGLLTYSLLNNMPRVAAENKNLIDVGVLFNKALKEVGRLAEEIGKEQQPDMIGNGSFDIGLISGVPPYPIPQSIPVFIRANFVNQRIRDVAHLSRAVNNYFDGLASQPEPYLAFWDVPEFAGDHYYLSGKYTLEGDKISGEAYLYRKDKEVASFPISGSVNELDKLAEQIYEKVAVTFD